MNFDDERGNDNGCLPTLILSLVAIRFALWFFGILN